jgi:hypothetical protein
MYIWGVTREFISDCFLMFFNSYEVALGQYLDCSAIYTHNSNRIILDHPFPDTIYAYILYIH